MVSGLASVVGTESGARVVVRSIIGIWGAGEGALDRQIGVVGVESVLVSISEIDLLLAPGGGEGVVRSRVFETFFFPFLGFLMLRGEGFATLGVRITSLRE